MLAAGGAPRGPDPVGHQFEIPHVQGAVLASSTGKDAEHGKNGMELLPLLGGPGITDLCASVRSGKKKYVSSFRAPHIRKVLGKWGWLERSSQRH